MNTVIPYTTLEPFTPSVISIRKFTDEVKFSNEAIPLPIAFERPDGAITRCETLVCTDGMIWLERSKRYTERLVKFLLWVMGASKIYIGGSEVLARFIKAVYSPEGARKFDCDFMTRLFGTPLEIISCGLDEVPFSKLIPVSLSCSLEGCRIGFDLGASDLKTVALIQGKPVFTLEREWQPGNRADPAWHKAFIRDAILQAASHLPHIDAIGGSIASIMHKNQPRIGSIFQAVPESAYGKVLTLFDELAAEFKVPFYTLNDGEVGALAGVNAIGENAVLGLSIGSSLGAGYVGLEGNLNGFLNELAFAPIDFHPDALRDPWSGDFGVGASYLSQQAVFHLASKVGITLPEDLTPSGKLAHIQSILESGDQAAGLIWQTMGVYLGYSLALYAEYYDFNHVYLQGRVTSGQGGAILTAQAERVLREQFPDIAQGIELHLPDEHLRRFGQAFTAASLAS